MDFQHAYANLVNQSRPREGDFFLPELGPAPGTDWQAWSRLRSEVARAAGAASAAYHRWGGTFTLRNAAYVTPNLDPVANWEMSINDPRQLNPSVVLSSVESAAARAIQESKDAEQRESGLTGLMAAFLRWPADLREAVGPGHGAQRTAAGVVGVVGQIFVAAVGGAIAVGIVAGAVALWKSVF